MDYTETWPRCPEAAEFCTTQLQAFLTANPPVAAMAARFLERAGVPLPNLIDHWILPETSEQIAALTLYGFRESATEGTCVWEHPAARLPRIRLAHDRAEPRLALAVEDIDHFLICNGFTALTRQGEADAAYEEALCALSYGELALVARRGYRGFVPQRLTAEQRDPLAQARTALQNRDRHGAEDAVLEQARQLFAEISATLGRGRATDEFFAAERDYYMTRNGAARWQYTQQQELGFGWANHDHHTYRCSRASFRGLITLFHTMGFLSRERFYAGEEAGWGAQVLEHPVSRVVIFADVDVAPEELNIDFAAVALPERDTLGTIGLWCALHGSSIAEAGMHHIEAEYDFVRAQDCQRQAGQGVMTPFTDFPMLKQVFTEPEIWPVAPERVAALRERDLITVEQAERFLAHGAAGSHLEILQRWDGFKGFNKTGISDIIRQTDARNETGPALSATLGETPL